MIKLITAGGLVLLLIVNFAVATYHAGVMIRPAIKEGESARGTWIDKEHAGVNHLILEGDPYPRGLEAGRLTKHLMQAQEDTLVGKLMAWIPSRALQQILVLAGIVYFRGVDDDLEPWMREEMSGVSSGASHDYDFLIDGFTRQMAYHGLHEVGQMMVDRGADLFGCTVVALPFKNSWILGRNFDFEGGRIFDDEKIVKWVFPREGSAYVSVIWAGMVGGVTGVNEHGLYVSINAAGSQDYRRIGMTSTLLLTKILQDARTIDDALALFEKTPMFITDLFVLLDRKSGRLVRIEKSPLRTMAIELKGPSVITNHLIAPVWADDSTNEFRRTELTSRQRMDRGLELLRALEAKKPTTAAQIENGLLAILRDKGVDGEGRPLHLGNRQAIDSMIATHSVIYNPVDQVLYVSGGPAVSGPFYGYDLNASFKARKPVATRTLPRDPQVTAQLVREIREGELQSLRARSSAHHKKCDEAADHLKDVPESQTATSEYQYALGELRDCQGRGAEAKAAWARALELQPAYAKTRRDLSERLAR